MRRILKYIMVFVAVCSVSSGCKRFLDVKPQGKVIPETEEEFAAVFNYRLNNIEAGVYDDVVGNAESIAKYEAFADDLNANVEVGMLPIYAGTEFNKHGDTYAGWYEVIKDCNIIIEAMEVKGSEHARQLKAAATGMKGVCYYNLLRNFCKAYNPSTAASELGLCIVDHFDITYFPARSDLKTSAEYVISVLEESAAYNIADPKYMFNKDVVDAYLAKAYFWIQDWSNCLRLCKGLAEKYPLVERADFKAMIDAEYEKMPGVIVRSRINDNHNVSSLVHGQALSDLNTRPVNGTLVHLFDADKEKDIRYTTYFDAKRLNKKEPYAKVREAEIFLMMAECQAHLGQEPEALATLNLIRSKRIENVKPYTIESLPEPDPETMIKVDAEGKALTPLMAAIFNERRKEMYLEGDRWFELKRNGSPEFWVITTDGMYQKYTMKTYMYTFPIRKKDVDLKDYLEQNEGYEEYI